MVARGLNPTGDLRDLDRVLGSHGTASGPEDPLFLVIGGLHGNEPAGIHAIERVLHRLRADDTELRGRLVGVSGNRRALALGERYLVEDLNRIWSPDRVARVRQGLPPVGEEESELRELLELFDSLLGEHRGPVVVLDLHSTSADGSPFAIAPDTLSARPIAMGLGVPLILGLEERLEGTLLAWFGRRGHRALCLEGGQSGLASTVDHHEAAIWLTLATMGMLDPRVQPELEEHRDRLAETAWGLPPVVEVRFRFHVEHDDLFEMVPGYTNFHFVKRGDELARVGGEAVPSPFDGLLVMPRYQGQGADGFFLGTEVRGSWLRVSSWVRRLGLARLLPLLPGIHRASRPSGSLHVSPLWARGHALELLHLFGFRRRRVEGTRVLFVRRPETH